MATGSGFVYTFDMHSSAPSQRKATRRALGTACTVALLVSVSACGTDGETEDDKEPIPHQDFVSRPDLTPPEVQITQGEAWSSEYENAEEYIFTTPNYGTETPSDGAVIFDSQGELVWMDPSEEDNPDDNHFDLRVQEYQDEPVLTYFQGPTMGGWGRGDIYLLDQSYEEVATVTTDGSLGPQNTDFHDTTITDKDTMLVAAYVPTKTDLSEIGGPEDGWAENAVIQEIDIESGEVLFEWSSLDHIPVTDTQLDFETEKAEQAEEDEENDEGDEDNGELGTEENPFDYFHINSVTVDDDESLLVSARHTHAVYQLNRDSGEVQWTLGGASSDFEMEDDAVFKWQHAAARDDDGTLTLLDNHAHGADDDESSRGLRLQLDEEAMTASVVTEYTPPEDRPAGSMANAQQLSNGNMLVGWGQQPYFSEYTNDGKLIYDVCHGAECYGDEYEGGGGSYRAYKAEWQGQPNTDPDVVIQQNQEGDGENSGEQMAYVSWNGATEVEQWRLVAGEDEDSATEQTTVDHESFETSLPLPEGAEYVAVEALDTDGNVLATGTPQE